MANIRLAALAVELVHLAGRATREVGDDIPLVGSKAAVLGLCDHAPCLLPGLGLVLELCEGLPKASGRAIAHDELGPGHRQAVGREALQGLVDGEADHVLDGVGLAPLVDLGRGESTVGTEEDRLTGPLGVESMSRSIFLGLAR